jgi:hypothetical protein
MNAVTLTWFKQSDDYFNFFIFTSENKNVLIPFLDILNLDGDVWTEEGTYYPLIVSKILEDHKYEFGFSKNDDTGKEQYNFFVLQTFTNFGINPFVPVNQEDLSKLLEDLKNNTETYIKDFSESHTNPYVKAFAEAIVDGKFKDIEFVVQEYTPGEIDKLVLE